MYLKSLTLKGFKSFAGSTTLRLEPGLTCVVGPNGSGKSNVVDSIAWVLGEQGARSLRGGSMSDVIFAGAPGRPPLGRAEVLLTIDNSDGALPIEYAEVTVGRLMYRSGESEYSINGAACRLLDVQELMSDSGIGRELHVVVGQGQLDAVLAARPEERRAFVEEAAGVLKHRKRKEKALRKLEAMSASLARICDLSAELRRQLGPLGRQAEVARRAGAVQAGLRDARLRLLADDLLAVTGPAAGDDDAAAGAAERAEAVQAELARLQERETELHAAADAATPRVAAAQHTVQQLTSLRERFAGLAGLARERARHLGTASPSGGGRDADALDAEAARLRADEAELAAALQADAGARDEAAARLVGAEVALAEEERRLTRAVRAASDRREGLVRLTGQAESARSRLTAGEQERARLAAAADAARARVATAAAEAARREDELGRLGEGELGLDERHDAACRVAERADALVAGLQREEREAERERAAARARHDALEQTVRTLPDGAAALLAAGLASGTVAALLDVAPGAEAALAAALGPLASGVTVGSAAQAADALAELRRRGTGRTSLLVGKEGPDAGASPRDGTGDPGVVLPAGARWAVDLVTAPTGLGEAVARLLGGTVVVGLSDGLPDLDRRPAHEQDRAPGRPDAERAGDGSRPAAAADRPAPGEAGGDGGTGVRVGLDDAVALLVEHPRLTLVTANGDVLAAAAAVGGTAGPSALELHAAAEEAARRLERATDRVTRLDAELTAARDAATTARGHAERALSELHDSDALMAGVAEALAQHAAAARAAAGEAERLEGAAQTAADGHDRDRAALATLVHRLAAAQAAQEGPDAAEPDPAGRQRLLADVAEARRAEVDARLAVRTGEERLRAVAGRAEGLVRAAAAERESARRARERALRRRQSAAVAAEVARLAEAVHVQVDAALQAAGRDRDAAAAAAVDDAAGLRELRSRLRPAQDQLSRLRDEAQREELARAERRLRAEALSARAVDELGIAPEVLLAEYHPGLPVPADDPDQPARPYLREEQETRARSAERRLAQLGRVNPLALEEYEALQERSAFLATQLEDLTRTRRDLLTVVREVDERVEEVFRAAYEDTAREFEVVFATLFPGGEGRLELTDPDDLLTTGIEVHARPAGKRVTRLSLLSGGERSLAAVALLLAIFRARPSPFYVLDEVEAALDDRNLGRLLEALEGLRERSQLIVITHQKRTMEIADALYGVSMRGDGVTTVVSQRLREPLSA